MNETVNRRGFLQTLAAMGAAVTVPATASAETTTATLTGTIEMSEREAREFLAESPLVADEFRAQGLEALNDAVVVIEPVTVNFEIEQAELTPKQLTRARQRAAAHDEVTLHE